MRLPADDVVLPAATARPETVFAEVTTPVQSLSTLVDQFDAGLLAAAQLVAREADDAFFDAVVDEETHDTAHAARDVRIETGEASGPESP